MSQDLIWDHFQNEGVASFDRADPRLQFLLRQLRPGERVLNIGVGSGALERLAVKRGIDIWALDPSERSMDALRRELSLGDHAQTGYSQNLPFPDDHFDAVVMSEVLEHLDEDVCTRSLREVRRVLRPSGRLLGTVPAREPLELSEVVCPDCGNRFHRWGHQTSFDVGSLRALLEADFRVSCVQERYFNEWEAVSWIRRLGGLAKKFLSWRGLGPYGLARNIFFIAEAPTDDGAVSMRTLQIRKA